MTVELKIKQEKRSGLYYSKYQYCCVFWIKDLSCIRYLTNTNERLARNFIGSCVESRDNWRQFRYKKDTHSTQKNLKSRIDDLVALLGYIRSSKKDHKLTISSDWGYYYTNDFKNIERLLMLSGIYYDEIRHINDPWPENSIVLKKSDYCKRSYFKEKILDQTQAQRLRAFLSNIENVRLSPSLREWCDQPYVYVRKCFFIDHNDDQAILMLSMMLDDPIRKTANIIEDK